MASQHVIRTRVCIAGGGPAGLTLALQLARNGCDVVVLEQSSGVERSFRGESLSPDTVWLLRQHGLLDMLPDPQLLEVRRMEVHDSGDRVLSVDFGDFGYPQRYPVELPQPMLLRGLAAAAEQHPGFRLIRQCTVTDLLVENGRTTGVTARSSGGPLTVRAEVVIGADGRYSRLRDLAGVRFTKIPLQRDFLWFKAPCPKDWDRERYGVYLSGPQHIVVIPTYPDLLRVGFSLPKDGFRQVRAAGLQVLHDRMLRLVPDLAETVDQHVTSWRDTAMLEIFATVAPDWHRGRVLLIGDAAHALSPVLAQGVNHAIVDAIVLAPMLVAALEGNGDDATLTEVFARFQREREPHVARSRRLQQRQENAFAASGVARVAARRALYRVIDRSQFLKRQMWRDVFYRQQHAHASGSTALVGSSRSRVRSGTRPS